VNQVTLSILVGLLAGVGGAFAVELVRADAPSGAGPAPAADLSALLERLDRMEARLGQGALAAAPTLRGSAGEGADESGGLAIADLDALAARLQERLEPALGRKVAESVDEALGSGDGARVRISAGQKRPKKKKATLAEAAADLGLSREEEDAVRRIAGETTDAFFKLLAGKDGSVEDVRREFEEAGQDPAQKAALGAKYMPKVFGNIGGLISLGLTHDSRMKTAVGPEKARKLDKDYRLTDLDPYGLEEMFDFD
jgi:hypothetical protein